MRRPALALALLAVTGSAEGQPVQEPASCAATPVTGTSVRAGPFRGAITPEYDVVDGRFRMRVGGMRDPETGLSQKIPWFVRRGHPSGTVLKITGKRLGAEPRTWRVRLGRTANPRGGYVFPSILKPPAEGCWRLTFRSGRSSGRLTVLVTPAP